jgi:hypothetical protein
MGWRGVGRRELGGEGRNEKSKSEEESEKIISIL